MAANGGKNSPKQISQQVDELNKKLGVTQGKLEDINQTLTVTQAQSQKATQRIGKNLKDINATLVSLQKEARAADARLARMVITGDAIRKSLVNGMTQSSTAMTTAAVSADRMNTHLHKTNMTTQDVVMNARRMTTAFQYAFALNPITMFLRKMIEVRGEFEMQSVALRAIMQNKDEADQLFNQITQLAVKSPFRVKDLLTYTKQLAAYRIENDQLYDTTKRLADVSAGLGVDMQRLILAYGQVKTANFLRASEVRQFTEAGVNMYGELARYFTEIEGKAVSTADVVERVSKRMVKFEDVAEVFRRMTNEGGIFYDMQEKQSYTVQGQIGKLKDSIDLMLNDIGTANQHLIKDAVTGITETLKNWHEVWIFMRNVAIELGTLKVLQAGYNLILGKATGIRLVDNIVQQGRIAGIKKESVEEMKFRDIINGSIRIRKKDIAALEQQISAEDRAMIIDQQRRANITALLNEEQRRILTVNGITEEHERYVAEAMNVMTADQRQAVAANDLTVNRERYVEALQRARNGEIKTWSQRKKALEDDISANEQQIYSLNNQINGHKLAKANIEKSIDAEKRHIKSINNSIAQYKLHGNAAGVKAKIIERDTAVTRLHELEEKRDAQATAINSKEQQINTLATKNNTIQTQINTQQTRVNTIAKRMQEAAVNGLKRAYLGLRAVMGGAIFGAAIMGITALVQHLTEASRKAKELQNNLAELANTKVSELGEGKSSFEKLKNELEATTAGTEARRDAVQKMNSQYGEYLNYLVDEKMSLVELRGAYEGVFDAMTVVANQKLKQEADDKKREALEGTRASVVNDITGENISHTEQVNIAGKWVDEARKVGTISKKDAEGIVENYMKAIEEELKKQGRELTKGELRNIGLDVVRTWFGDDAITAMENDMDNLADFFTDLGDAGAKMQKTILEEVGVIGFATKEEAENYKTSVAQAEAATEAENKRFEQEVKNINAKEQAHILTNKQIEDEQEKHQIALLDIQLKYGLITQSKYNELVKNARGELSEYEKDYNKRLQKMLGANWDKDAKLLERYNRMASTAANMTGGLAARNKEIASAWKKAREELQQLTKAKAAGMLVTEAEIKQIEQEIKDYETSAQMRGIDLADKQSRAATKDATQDFKSMLNLVKQMQSEYEKLTQYYDKNTAAAKVRNSYEEAFNQLISAKNRKKYNISVDMLDFSSKDALADSLTQLEKYAKTLKKEAAKELGQFVAKMRVEFEIENKEQSIKDFNNELKDMMADYNRTIEARKLNIPTDIAMRLFGAGGTTTNDMRRRADEIAQQWVDEVNDAYEKETGKKGTATFANGVFGGMAGDDMKKYEDAYKRMLDDINKLDEKANEERMRTYVKYLENSFTKIAAARVKLMQQFLDIDKLTDKDGNPIDEAIRKQMKTAARKESDKSIDKAIFEDFKGSDMYTRLFENMENASDVAIRAMLQKLQELRNSLTNLDPANVKTIVSQIEKLEAELNKRGFWLGDSLRDYQRQIEQILPKVKELGVATGALNKDKLEGEISRREGGIADEQANITALQQMAELRDENNNLTQEEFTAKLKELQTNGELIATEQQIAQFANMSATEMRAEAVTRGENVTKSQGELQILIRYVNLLNKRHGAAKKFGSDWKNTTNVIKGAFGEIMDNLDLFTDETNNETKAFKEVGNAILDVIAIIPTYVAGMTAAGVAINSAMGIIGLIAEAISLTMGLIKALAGMNDAKQQDKIDKLEKEVRKLQESFEDLENAMDNAMNVGDYASNYEEALNNLDEQYRKTTEMINAERSKKDSDEEKIEEYEKNQRDLLKEKEELKQKLIQDWGGVGRDNWRSMAEDFVSAWMDAFEETGDGLEGLEKKFDEWLKNWFQKQATMKVASAMLEPLFRMIDEMTSEEHGLGLDTNEMEQIRQRAAEIFPQLNESLKEMWEAFDMGGGAIDSLTGLQQGIEGITEATAEVIEGYLNSIRYFVAEDNAILIQIRDSIVGGVAGSGIADNVASMRNLLEQINNKLPDMTPFANQGGVMGLNVRIVE